MCRNEDVTVLHRYALACIYGRRHTTGSATFLFLLRSRLSLIPRQEDGQLLRLWALKIIPFGNLLLRASRESVYSN